MLNASLKNKSILLGVCGSVAAYRAADIARELIRKGAVVHVVMTIHARKFVAPMLFEALTGNPVTIDSFDEPETGKIAHIYLPRQSDLFLVAPATAHTIAKLAHGLADDMLSTAYLANRAPVLIAPAMNPNMLEHTATQANISALKQQGVHFVEPAFGSVACGDEGKGKLAAIEDIISEAERILSIDQDMNGLSVLVTAGPTQESLDPVRYISNRSSGKMGYAIAEVAAERGADVTLITGPTALKTPDKVNVVKVMTADEMYKAVSEAFSFCDVFISSAAVADYKAEILSKQKIKREKDAVNISLIPNPDILAEMGKRKEKQIVVGFAAETNDLIDNASVKLKTKHCDIIAANDVSRSDSGFDSDFNKITLLFASGKTLDIPLMSKREAAKMLCDEILSLIKR